MKDRTQLIHLVSIDLACGDSPDSLDASAVLAGDDGWEGLLEAAEVRQEDDRACIGYVVKAWVEDPATDNPINSMEWLDLCQHQVDRMFEHLGKYELSSLRWSIVGAGPVPAWLIERYQEHGIDLLQDYGLTESCGPATVISSEEAVRKPDSAGKACFHSEVRIVDDDGCDVRPGQLGEILIRAEKA